MDHPPIYRAGEHRKPAPVLPLRRTVSILSAAAALAVSGIALGYHGLGDVSVDVPRASSSVNAAIAIPVPGITFPSVDSGHPDLLAQLSTSLLTRIEPAAVVAAPASLPARPAPVIAPPTLVPTLLAVDIGPAEGPSPTDVVAEEAILAVPDDVVIAARRGVSAPVAPVQVAARAAAPAALAAAPTDDVEVEAATVAAPPVSQPAPVKAAAVVHEATPVPKAVVKEPTTEPKRVEATPVPERKEAQPQPQESAKAHAANVQQDDVHQDGPKGDAPGKPQADPPHQDKPSPDKDKPAPGKSKGHG